MKSAKTLLMAATLIAGISFANGQNQFEPIPQHWQTGWIEAEPTPMEKAEMKEAKSGLADSLLAKHPFRPAVATTFNQMGDSLYKYEYFYDPVGMEYGGNNALSEFKYTWDKTSQKWVNSMRLTKVFDDKRQIVIGYTDNGNGDEWTSRSRVCQQYDENGNKIDWMQGNWTENGWYDNYHGKLAYDEHNRKIEETYENRFTSAEWVHTSKYTWKYDGNGHLIEHNMLSYLNGEYESMLLAEYEYNEDGKEITRQQSKFDTPTVRMESTYDEDGNLARYLSKQWNDSLKSWQDYTDSYFAYDSLNRLSSGLLIRIDSLGNRDSVERYVMTYNYMANGYGFERKHTDMYNDSLGEWVGTAEETWFYAEPGKGKLTSWMLSVPTKGWTGYQSIQEQNYTYDANGFLIRQLFEDVSRDTVMSADAITRIPTLDFNFTYDSLGNGILVKAAVKGSRDYVFIDYNNNADQWGCADFESFAASIQYIDLRNFVEAESMEIDSTSLNMRPYDERQLHARVVPDSASNREIAWSSSEPEIAAVDVNGHVYAFAEGTAIITAQSSYNPAIAATCTVTVAEPEDPTPPDPQANEENNKGDFRVWSRDQVLYVESSNEKDEIFVIDMNGRILYKGLSTEIPVENSGLYIVRQGNNIQKTIVH